MWKANQHRLKWKTTTKMDTKWLQYGTSHGPLWHYDSMSYIFTHVVNSLNQAFFYFTIKGSVILVVKTMDCVYKKMNILSPMRYIYVLCSLWGLTCMLKEKVLGIYSLIFSVSSCLLQQLTWSTWYFCKIFFLL
jgi:hypothetical protein